MKASQNTIIKRAVIENVKKDMGSFGLGEFELLKRITVKLDEEQFNSKEDESVWLQKHGKAPFVCEVYFDNVWMCDLHETDTHNMLRVKFLKGFEKAYDNNKIRLNQLLGIQLDEMEAEAKKMAKRELKDSIEALPEATPEEKVSKEIIKDIAKENDAQLSTNANT